MFSTTEIAKVIREKRIEKNMTQMQLADALGISYQAVSNWERGNSMPDISKLGELAGILGCSVEEILGNDKTAKIVTNVMKVEDTKELQVDMEELEDIAPLLPPRQTESILGEILKQEKDMQFSDLCGIAPFLSKEALDSLVKKELQQEKDLDYDDLCGLAPFLAKETLDAVVERAIKDSEAEPQEDGVERLEEMAGLYPFLSKQSLQRLAETMIKNWGWGALSSIISFL